jgi:iron complex outermembrane receptor protein
MKMIKKRSAVAIAQAFAVGGMIAASPWAMSEDQPAGSSSATPEPVQRVTITGSAIKRTDSEGPAPVEIISKKDIERTGATSVNELLKSISTIDIFDQGELTSNSPTGSGSSNLRMRGLDESNVLVLLNGKRLPTAAMTDTSGAGSAVDLNTIPLAAIERIEILKDGGSAIYGSDAVAGVVNFITKRDYQGAQAFAYYGAPTQSGGKETQYGGTAGFGDLEKDRFNVMFTLEKFDRDPILRKDRESSRSVDFRRFGGSDLRSSFAPQGNVLDPNTFGWTGVTLQPCPAANFSGNRCRFDFNASVLTAYNGADRLSGMLNGTFKLGSDLTAFLNLVHA